MSKGGDPGGKQSSQQTKTTYHMCDLDGYGMTLTCHRVTRIVALRISGVGSATLLSAFDTRELGGYFANVATQPARTTFASSKSQDGQPRLGIKTWVACRRRQILYSPFVRWNDANAHSRRAIAGTDRCTTIVVAGHPWACNATRQQPNTCLQANETHG